ncbi:MaoC family dehydratase N-terminal domain-containing protein [Noviherbaspirillum sedimenti]|uniref:MaoC family dehydratase n=1 Tax=Noviherbaspirillum sedimenti TaxID=2320865 RepID=A0A3A3GLW4_9BURK|nr:MaoC family dehydratase N-terminal domain-containing protein [Noviherbaspirillum sedimenti]RJG03276.1 MaoC family dehydratase [Noviherbaspirillum sedimenti]
MYINREQALELKLAPINVEVERGRLRLFAKANGETNPVYSDVEAARAAGYPDLPVPPSFLGNAVELDIPDPLSWMSAIGIDTSSTLHGEQSMVYHAMAFAGDNLTLHRRIVDVYTKKGGALEFAVKKTDIMRGDTLVAESYCSIAVLHPEANK